MVPKLHTQYDCYCAGTSEVAARDDKVDSTK